MSEETTLPFKMERPFHRADYRNGSLTITFTDAAHLADAWNFARGIGKEEEFNRAMLGLVRVALGAALPDRGESPGADRKITISPDSHDEPSFFWQEERGMHGGLIWHHRSGQWSIHT